MATTADEIELNEIGALLRAGRAAEARARVRAALAAGRESDALLGLAGMLATQAGDAAEAVDVLERLLARRSGDRATRINLAGALIATGAHDRVEPLLSVLPREPAADRLIAYAAMQTGDLARARNLYRDVVTAYETDADSWANLGTVHAGLGEHDAAIDAYERAIGLRRDDVRFYLALAGILEQADRPIERRNVARDAAALRPDDPAVQIALGLAEAAMDDMDAAEAALRRAVDLAPGDAAAVMELGLLLEAGNRLAALDALIAAARPSVGDELALLEAWAAFRAGRFEEADTQARRVPETINALRRANLIAAIADRRGDPAEAFAAYEAMNRAALDMPGVSRAVPSYRERVVAETAALRAAGAIAPVPANDVLPNPVFIVGFPRSGTTLLDTMIGALPDTLVLEERPLIPTIERAVGSVAKVLVLDPAALRDLRQRYRTMLSDIAPGATHKRVVDKHPLHMARMPLIDRLFPGAPILFVERHPYDVVLSCFIANFRLNHAMVSFTDLEEAARTYDAVFTAWSEAEARLPLNVHRVRYERMVENTSAELGAALGFIGADADAAAIDHVAAAQGRARIRTASYAQVTEPVYRRSVARWKRYREQLAPVIPVLAPWAERMGYER